MGEQAIMGRWAMMGERGGVCALACRHKLTHKGACTGPPMLQLCRVWERAGNASFLQGLGNGTLDA